MRRVVASLLSCVILTAQASVQRSNTQDQMQILYKQITNELIGIRKDFSMTQPRVYTLLDQVDKMYNVTKNIHEKKLALETQINHTSSSIKKINEENKILKDELSSTKQKFELTFKQLETTHKQLEAEKTQATQLSKEKHALQSKLSQAETEKGAKMLDEKIKEKVTKSVEAEVAAQIKNLAEAQSLSLTSTSAPISPR